MQILIDIPYGHFLTIKDGFLNECIKSTTEAIVNGTILPKGHGRLIDVDELEQCKGIMNTIHGEIKYAIRMDDIRNMPTIIEADNEVEE